MIEVTDQAHLEALPDGTIITWDRIAGDPTSTAVAFVRVEVVAEDTPAYDAGERIVWISPGGWQPMTPDDAGITYPVRVVVLGEYRPTDSSTALADMLDASTTWATLETGGTHVRSEALAAAARMASQWFALPSVSTTEGADVVVGLAERFADWLTAEPPQPAPMLDDPYRIDSMLTAARSLAEAPSLGDMADLLRAFEQLGVTRAALDYASDQVWPK